MKKKKYDKWFLFKFTVNERDEVVRINRDNQSEAEIFFKKLHAPNCIINEIVDITEAELYY